MPHRTLRMTPLRVVAPALLALALLAGVLPAPSGAASASPGEGSHARTASMSAATYESKLLGWVNRARVQAGCPKLRLNSALRLAGRRHSEKMRGTRSLSHQLPREPSLQRRVEAAGYKKWRRLAENIAYGSAGISPRQVYLNWMNSAPHRRNIRTCAYRDAGIGVRYGGGVWVTLDLGRR